MCTYQRLGLNSICFDLL